MGKATRVGDLNTGHDSCPPVALATGSSNVLLTGGRRVAWAILTLLTAAMFIRLMLAR